MKDSKGRHILGFEEMDVQHKYLHGLFDQIENFSEVQDSAFMKKLLEEIERYLIFHFTCEEHLMRLYNTPGFAIHQSDHERVASKFVGYLDDFDQNRLNPASLRIFLTGWLMEHSEISDSEYVNHIVAVRKQLGMSLES